ncbi:MAG: UDP-2,3-diacylglucosamine diphosphatase [bacterium]
MVPGSRWYNNPLRLACHLSAVTIAFISDLHLTPDRPVSTRLFEEFVADAGLFLRQLYVLGDLFEYWIGDDGAELLGHEDVEVAIRKIVDSGTDVFFLHGNRDFLVGQSFSERTGCKLLPDPIVVDFDQTRILLTHGDALCTDDIEHQEARRQMLSSKWKAAFLDKTLDQRFQTADTMRKESEINKLNKSMEIMDVNQEAVETLMLKHDVDLMIHGHTHKPAAHEFTLNGRLKRRYVLGDWYTQKSAIFYNDGKLVLRR